MNIYIFLTLNVEIIIIEILKIYNNFNNELKSFFFFLNSAGTLENSEPGINLAFPTRLSSRLAVCIHIQLSTITRIEIRPAFCIVGRRRCFRQTRGGYLPRVRHLKIRVSHSRNLQLSQVNTLQLTFSPHDYRK